MNAFKIVGVYTNQQIINAIDCVAQTAGRNLWDLVNEAGIAGFLQDDNRRLPYTDLPLDQWGLSQEMIEAIMAALAGMPALPPPYVRKYDEIVLNVPWISQLGGEAEDPNDCGPACVLMLLRAAGKVDEAMTVEDINEVMFPNIVGMDPQTRHDWLKDHGKTGTGQLVSLAAKYGLALKKDKVDAGLDKIYQALDEGRAVILGIEYANLYIHGNWADEDRDISGPNQGGHWFLVIGYRGEDFVVNDPLWVRAQTNGGGGEKWDLTRQRILDATSTWSENMVY